ncbi:MAG: hypothetical protein AB7G12_12830 [Thermoanaerobaculia bacterium]
MVSEQRSLADQAMQVAAELGRLYLRGEQIDDCISTAWELSQSGRGNPVAIAWFAVKRVRAGRQFGLETRSIDSPQARREGRPERSGFDVAEIARTGDNPSIVATFRIDFSEWLSGLPKRLRRMAVAMAAGESTGDMAKRFGVSAARISQIRRELAESWFAQFTE